MARTRYRLIALGSLLAGVGFFAFAVRQGLGALPVLAAIDLAFALICWGNLVWLRRYHRGPTAGHVLVGILFSGLSALVFTSGGVGLPAPFLLCTLPIAATAMVGSARAAIGWSAASVLVLAAVLGLHSSGHDFSAGLQVPTAGVTFGTAIGAVLLTSALAFFTTRLQTRALENLEAVNQCLAKAELDAKAASAAKSQFLANMSHEIRTPMNGILGSLQLLDGTEGLPEEGRALSGTAVSSARALLALLDDIIDLAKVESGKMAYERVPYDIARMLGEVVGLFSPTGQAKGLRVELSPGNLEPTWVYGDPVRVRQVLTNLVGNAIKFTPKGYVRVELQDCNRAGEKRLCLTVHDTGIGIPEEKQAAIFDAFEQADPSTTRVHGGTGLGLAVSKQLVEGMGGKLRLESEVDKGTRFFVELPYVPAPAQPISGPNPRVTADAEVVPKALLVEDNPVNQMVARRMLERLGYTVKTCDDGAAAIEVATRSAFDVIFMDCHMPTMDGYQAARALREHGIRTPIIALTASAMKEDRDRCEAAGMDDFLAKPVDQRLLWEALDRWVGDRTRPASA